MAIETHCCISMKAHLDDGRGSVTYIPKFREYGILYRDAQSMQQIQFCPWCGASLPSSLRDQWFDELEKLGLEPEDQLPSDLTSDMWWRKESKEPGSN